MPQVPNQLTKKPVAIVTWPINDVGGINSWCINFCKALASFGVPYQVYYATAQTRFGCDPDKPLVKARHSLLPAIHLSYRKELLRTTIRELNQYSLIVMLHPSPHPTRANANKPDSANWMKLYRDTTAKKLVIFHDANWRKTNEWFADVADHVDAAIAAQKLFIHSLMDYPADCPKTWEYFPLDLEKGRLFNKPLADRTGGIVCTQWLKWKNHHKFLPQLPEIKEPIDLYGNGQEYYTLKKTGVFQKVIRYDAGTGDTHNKSSLHNFRGFEPYESVLKSMGSKKYSIDLSTKGYTNMTHWEPLTMRTISMVERRVFDHPDNMIPHDCCQHYDLDNAAEAIARLCRNPQVRTNTAINAEKFITISGHEQVTYRIFKWLKHEAGIIV